EGNRLHDSMLLDMLLRLARDDTFPRPRDLAVVAGEYAGLVVDKADPYRKRYGEILGRDWAGVEEGVQEGLAGVRRPAPVPEALARGRGAGQAAAVLRPAPGGGGPPRLQHAGAHRPHLLHQPQRPAGPARQRLPPGVRALAGALPPGRRLLVHRAAN